MYRKTEMSGMNKAFGANVYPLSIAKVHLFVESFESYHVDCINVIYHRGIYAANSELAQMDCLSILITHRILDSIERMPNSYLAVDPAYGGGPVTGLCFGP